MSKIKLPHQMYTEAVQKYKASGGSSDIPDGMFSSLVWSLGSFLGNYLTKLSDSRMTGGQKERTDYQTQAQNWLDEQAYMRQRQYFEDYLSVPAQVSQYKEAGINPMMMFGGGPSVSASGGVGTGSSAASQSATGADNLLGTLLSSMLGFKQYGLDKQATEAEVSKKNAETIAQQIANKFAEERNTVEIDRIKRESSRIAAEEDQIRANIPLILANTEYARYMSLYAPEFFESTIGKNRADALRSESQVRLNDKEIERLDAVIRVHQKEVAEIDAKIALISSEIELNASQKSLNEQSIKESEKRIEKMSEEIKKIGKEIGLTEKEIQYYVWNHPRQSSVGVVRWNNSSSDGSVRDKLSSTISDEELIMYVRERFGQDAADSLQK